LILIYTKSLDDFYIHLFRTAKKNANSNSTHSFSYLWDLYKNDLWLIFSKSFYVSIWLIISALIIKKVKLKIFKILILVLFAWFGLYFTIEIYEYEKWKYMIYAIGVASLLLYLIFSDNYKNDFSILFFSIILFFISFFGSNNGIRILLASGAGIFSISAFILLLKSVKLKFNNIEYNFHISILSILIFIFLLINENKPKDIYRDYPREKITTYFQSRPLIGIKSEKSKVEVVDSLYHFLKSNVSKDNSIMCVTTIQMLYFILDKKYHTYDLWKQPETEFKNINKKKDIDYFIFPLKNPRIHHWIKKHDKPLAKNDSINYKFYKNIVIEKKYLKVYTNSMFEVFKKAD
ncbi:MAG: hypothetical protein JXA16_02530, partial [Bacteroidales bacterium]|nr:hypothetical protein [Bacteroidales bacterium]